MRKRRLLWQIYLPYLFILLVSLFAITWHAGRFLRQSYLDRAKTDLEAQARLLAKYIEPRFSLEDAARIDQLCKELGRESETRITVILPSGKVVGDSDEDPATMDNHAGRPEVGEALAGRRGVSVRYSYTVSEKMMYVAIPVVADGQTTGIMRAAISVTHIDKALKTISMEMAIGGVVIAVVAAAISRVISRRLSRPLEEMKKGAERFAKGDLERKLSVPDTPEIAALAETMNQMAAELGEKMRTAMQQRNEQEAVLSSMAEGVLAIDTEERLLNMNQAAARLLGVEPSYARGRSMQEVVRNTELQTFIRNALASAEPVEGGIVLFNGGERFLQVRGTTLRDSRGSNIGAVIVLGDVTSLRRLENIRRDFVANVSHELKTPVTSIKGFVETLLDGALRNSEDAERFLHIIAKQADRLNAIIEDLLSLAKIEQEAEKEQIVLEKRRVCDVLRAAIQACETSACEKGIAIELSCPDTLTAAINAPLLEQAFVNLLDNAVKYSESGSTASVEAAETAAEVVIHVRDQGCGIREEHLSRIFERFYRVDKARSRRLGGTGLGLAIVKHITQAHGGHVTVQSAPGKGSTFSIHLPK